MEWFASLDHWAGRLVFQRGLAVVYAVAFVCAARQFRALFGARGLTPVPHFTARVPFRRAPSVFQLHYSDRFFAVLAWTGAALAVAVALGLGDLLPLAPSMGLWLVLWVLYLSIVNAGGLWYAFGWESLLLEAGFLAVFLGNDEVAPPLPVLLALWWLLFRLEFGAGLIKWRGDRCWRELTCLYHHHQTQPMPGPLSWFFHRLPRSLHRVEAAANHVAQLGVPVLLFAPQPVAGWAAGVLIATQMWLVLSGNFAWLNWLTLLLAATALPPGAFTALPPGPLQPSHGPAPLWFHGLSLAVGLLVAVLSYWPVRNMLSPRQQMNRSFNPLHLVNTYGAFGSVTRVRHEIVLEGTTDASPGDHTRWREYGFHGKPGEVRRLPRQFAPYHLRLDWMLWFAALSPAHAAPWFDRLILRLLEDDRPTLRLLRHNPFPDGPPAHVRAVLYRYRFTTWRELRSTGAWWHREAVGEYRAPVGLSRPGR